MCGSDYILVNKKVKNELIEALKQSIQEFYGTNIEESPDFGRIVNDKHFNRLNELLNVHQNHVISVVMQMLQHAI